MESFGTIWKIVKINLAVFLFFFFLLYESKFDDFNYGRLFCTLSAHHSFVFISVILTYNNKFICSTTVSSYESYAVSAVWKYIFSNKYVN